MADVVSIGKAQNRLALTSDRKQMEYDMTRLPEHCEATFVVPSEDLDKISGGAPKAPDPGFHWDLTLQGSTNTSGVSTVTVGVVLHF